MKRMNVLTSIVMMSVLLSIPQAFESISADPGDPMQGTLYGVDNFFGPGAFVQVVTIDPLTGFQTPLLNPIQDFNILGLPGLAYDKVNGVLYATEGGAGDTIYSIDTSGGPSTGIETALGPGFGNLGLGIANVASLDFRANGDLYGAANIAGDGGTGPDHLVTIDLTSGAASIVGPFDGVCQPNVDFPFPADGTGACGLEGIAAIGFDANDDLWGIQRQGGGLYSIDKGTGVATFVGPIANQPPGGIASMEFVCDGTIYVGSHSFSGGELGIVTLNGNGGIYAPIGGGTSFGAALAGLAFDTACESDEQPTAVGGEILPISTASLLVAGVQSSLSWMVALAASVVGIGALIIKKKFI